MGWREMLASPSMSIALLFPWAGVRDPQPVVWVGCGWYWTDSVQWTDGEGEGCSALPAVEREFELPSRVSRRFADLAGDNDLFGGMITLSEIGAAECRD